ncbi:HNH endonuclease [Mycobacteroides abscessus]|uniref:HNH endonuclease n=1 Tax=Mycobacteroides abscessus TaxID=36809 RepID=UPI000A5B6244|nr:HNH endonuclease [Mycobacteroides abscessus]
MCLGCGAPLTKRSQKVYCGNACQALARRDVCTQLWLESGEAWVDSRRGHYIRAFLTEAQSDRCAICGGASSWQGSPLVFVLDHFVLDHVDGNPVNNCRDNLRLVCPNCDSQLPTYKSRNRGNGRSSRRRRYADGKSY